MIAKTKTNTFIFFLDRIFNKGAIANYIDRTETDHDALVESKSQLQLDFEERGYEIGAVEDLIHPIISTYFQKQSLVDKVAHLLEEKNKEIRELKSAAEVR